MSTMSAQILRKAAQILQVNGRHIGEYYDASQALIKSITPSACPVCVNGAIVLAAGLDVQRFYLDDPTMQAARDAVSAIEAVCEHLHIPVGHHYLARWHDGSPIDGTVGRRRDRPDPPTNEQVLAALTDTADALDGLTVPSSGR